MTQKYIASNSLIFDTISKIEDIEELYNMYITNKNFVYKSCNIEWIIVLEKNNNTIMDENLLESYNDKYICCTGKNLKIVKIFNKFYPKDSSLSIKDKSWISTEFNVDSEITHEINFYKCIECAFYDELNLLPTYTGIYKSWHPNGTLKISGFYVSGKKEYQWITNYSNRKLQTIITYKNGIPKGDVISYKENGHFNIISYT